MAAEIFPIRVNGPVPGRRPSTDERVDVVPGAYDAQWISTTKSNEPEQVLALRVLAADAASGEPLDIHQADWPELTAWPKFDLHGAIERRD
jgi:hypothetical protein